MWPYKLVTSVLLVKCGEIISNRVHFHLQQRSDTIYLLISYLSLVMASSTFACADATHTPPGAAQISCEFLPAFLSVHPRMGQNSAWVIL